jgi:hypothetical protein
MADAGKKTTTTITRTVRVEVEFDQDHVRALLRKEGGAPATDATVTWSTTEEQ